MGDKTKKLSGDREKRRKEETENNQKNLDDQVAKRKALREKKENSRKAGPKTATALGPPFQSDIDNEKLIADERTEKARGALKALKGPELRDRAKKRGITIGEKKNAELIDGIMAAESKL